jgi:cleavage stimulation factor subunit 3
LLQSRIIFAFKQAQMALRFYPEIWFEFSQYYLKLSMASHAETTYKAASEANPTRYFILILHFFQKLKLTI